MPFPDNKEDLTVFIDDLTEQMVSVIAVLVEQFLCDKSWHADDCLLLIPN